MELKRAGNKRLWITLAAVCLSLALIFGACAAYLSDYYRADAPAIAAFLEQGSSWKEEPNGNLVFGPQDAEVGFIFYPGGKVEHTAYLPLAHLLAEQGILCVIAEMPFRLAVLDMNAADAVMRDYPSVTDWYIGGHSLGGSMAASYAAANTDAVRGLVLLGAYSTADLSTSAVSVLSLYGSEDGVMNREKYEDCKSNLPKNFTEILIEGGNHAGFGLYGEQAGDGAATLSGEEQIRLTADAILNMIQGEN